MPGTRWITSREIKVGYLEAAIHPLIQIKEIKEGDSSIRFSLDNR
jgi:hypothetical protein